MTSYSNRAAQRAPRSILLALVCLLLLMSSLSSAAAPSTPGGEGFAVVKLPSQALSLPASFAQAKTAANNPKMDSVLAELATASRTSMTQALALAQASALKLAGDRVQVKITTHAAAAENVTRAVVAAGGEVTGRANGATWLQAWLPIAALDALAAEKDVDTISRPAEAVLMATTEGLAVINGPAWHSAGLRGAGVKVAIIDGGFLGYTALRGTELPASVTVKNFVDGESDAQVDGTSEHGTACAEIIHDIAPDASIYLVKINTDIDLQEAVTWVMAQNVHVISTSLGWYSLTPGDGTGYFADLVQTARNAGIFWTTAAGNDRESHWGGAYSDPNSNGSHNFNGAQEINYFGPGDGNAYMIPAGYRIAVFLRWDDWTAVNQDYDLYLVRWSGSTWQAVAGGEDVQNGGAGQTPTEFAVATTSGSDTAYGYAVVRFDSNRNVNLEVFTPKVPVDERVYARSLGNLADAPAALTVAALDVNSPFPQESYSSEGPTNGPGGTATGGAIKPDIAGFANVSTASYPNPAEKFNGTSAATPHVAGAAVLVKGAYPAYTPAQIRSFLEGRAIDMGTAGKDTLYGYGRLNLGAPPAAMTADVSIAKRVNGSNFTPGGPVQFTLTIANPGSAAASSIVITDLVPSQVTNLSYNSTLPVTQGGGAAYTWNLASLAAGASGTITINGTLSPSLPQNFKVVNTATVSAANDSNPNNNSSSATVSGIRLKVYLPLVVRRWPPVPDAPVLNAIDNADGDGNYTVTWNAAAGAGSYTLQEDDNDAFSSPDTKVDHSAAMSWAASGKGIGTYYYRVKATNAYGDSAWSNVQPAVVPPPVAPPTAPVLNAIDNADGDGNYTVTWNAAAGASSYTLQEDDNSGFSSPDTRVDHSAAMSWAASGKGAGTYYYRVKATNVSGDSAWSNVRSVVVPPPPSGPTPGFWQKSGGALEFYVSTDRQNVKNFSIYLSVTGCGNYKLTRVTPAAISGGNFSFTGQMYGSGTFASSTAASGTVGLNGWSIYGCGTVTGGPWPWTASWVNGTQPTVSVTAAPVVTEQTDVETPFTVTRVP